MEGARQHIPWLGHQAIRLAPPPSLGQLVALVDCLQKGALTESQANAVCQLRRGLLLLNETTIQDVKVLTQGD